MQGETVAVYIPSTQTEDEYGDTVTAYDEIIIDDVLVRPLSGSDLGDIDRPDGIRVAYTLAFPKTYTGQSLQGAKIALIERGMTEQNALHVSGSPDVTCPCPTKWNMLVEVGRVYG